MPQTTPPRIWLPAVLVFRMRPAATALTTRVTRIDAELLVHLHLGEMRRMRVVARVRGHRAGLVVFSCSMRSTAPCRIASAIDTAREASRLLTSLPSASATSSGAAFASGEFGICFARRSSSSRIASAVVAIPFATEVAIHDPPSTGDCGRLEVAELDADVVERQPEHVGRDLRHDGVGAGADVGGRARHLGMAVGGEHDAHRDRHLQRFPDAGRHAPADQIAAVAHRARLGIALVPAERLRALAVAFAQRLAAERLVLVLVAVRVAPQAKLERIELERDRKLVHRGFERITARWRRSARACRTRSGDRAARAGARISRWRTCRAGRTSRSPADGSPRIARSR